MPANTKCICFEELSSSVTAIPIRDTALVDCSARKTSQTHNGCSTFIFLIVAFAGFSAQFIQARNTGCAISGAASGMNLQLEQKEFRDCVWNLKAKGVRETKSRTASTAYSYQKYSWPSLGGCGVIDVKIKHSTTLQASFHFEMQTKSL